MERLPVLCCSPKLKHISKDSRISLLNKMAFIIGILLIFQKAAKTMSNSHSLTIADGAGSTGLRQAVALPHGAAQTDVHEALRGS